MTRSISFRIRAGFFVLALLASIGLLAAQQAEQKASFYDIQISKDQFFSYKNLKFAGDFTSFESPSGFISLGSTEPGVTAVVIVGAGSVTIEAPEAAQEKIKAVFGVYPLKTSFKAVYVRLNPKEYAETLGALDLTKATDEDAFKQAKEIFDQRFLGSYHAGPKAMLPDYKFRRMEFETEAHGWIVNWEHYWLDLFRVSPYAKIYAANFVNPKKK
jgi:hypothetical protein